MRRLNFVPAVGVLTNKTFCLSVDAKTRSKVSLAPLSFGEGPGERLNRRFLHPDIAK